MMAGHRYYTFGLLWLTALAAVCLLVGYHAQRAIVAVWFLNMSIQVRALCECGAARVRECACTCVCVRGGIQQTIARRRCWSWLSWGVFFFGWVG